MLIHKVKHIDENVSKLFCDMSLLYVFLKLKVLQVMFEHVGPSQCELQARKIFEYLGTGRDK